VERDYKICPFCLTPDALRPYRGDKRVDDEADNLRCKSCGKRFVINHTEDERIPIPLVDQKTLNEFVNKFTKDKVPL
jgi:uncharacterized protein YbaR (Trm112 family)